MCLHYVKKKKKSWQRIIAIELFKVKDNLSKTRMNDISQIKTLTNNFRTQADLARSFLNTSRYWLEFTFLFCLRSVEHSSVGYFKSANNFHISKNKIMK